MRSSPVDTSTGEVRDGFAFYAGHLALDLPATLRGRLRGTPKDLLTEPQDLARWLRAAGMSSNFPATTSADLAHARGLRENIYALALARIAGDAEDVRARSRRTLNRLAAERGAQPQLDPRGVLHWSGSVPELLATLAADAVRLFGSVQAARIRQCEAEACARLFLDTSRSGERRWCSMTSCGNKAKVAEFRRRQRAKA
jgi:predicted RNA-binding Zn ribbon-like protein